MKTHLLALATLTASALGAVASAQQFQPADSRLSVDEYFALPHSSVGTGIAAEPEQGPPVWGQEAPCLADDCGYCEALWTIRASAVFMERTGFGPEPFRFDFDHEPGVDLSFIRQLGPCHDIELRYLGVYGWQADLDFQGALARNRSELHSTEVNLRRRLGRMNLLAGFRWVEFMDDLQLVALGFPPLAVGSNINNHLYGGQIGLDGTLWDNGCRFRLDGFLKAGLYYNHIDRQTFVAVGPPVNLFLENLDSADKTAFVGELGVIGVYQLNDRWAVRGGYQMLWLEGVALAPDLSFPLETDGTFAHGAVAGVEWTY